MRLFFISLLALFTLAGAAQNYTIKGKANNEPDGKVLYLVDQNTLLSTDSVVVSNGAFEFKGSADDQLLFELKNIEKRGREKVYIFIAPGSNVSVDLTTVPAIVSDNGGMNDIISAIDAEVKEKGDILNKRIVELQNEGKSRDEIAQMLNPDVEAVFDIYRNGIEDNKDNMVGAYILAMLSQRFYQSAEELDAVMAKVKYADRIDFLKKKRSSYKASALAEPGTMFIDFAGFAVDGKPSKLSDYVGKGKYVLVDFWASWCGPCRKEIPNLLELQNRFAGDNFTVLGVNVWDNEDKFKASLQSEGINYPQIFVPRNNKDNATELYDIKGIPQIILFAPDGTIIKRDLRGAAMKALVEGSLK